MSKTVVGVPRENSIRNRFWSSQVFLGEKQIYPVLSQWCQCSLEVCGVEWQIYKYAATEDAAVTAEVTEAFTRAMQPRQRTMPVALHPC